MGHDTLSRDAYTHTLRDATQNGTKRATFAAEERVEAGKGLDPLVDPKGLPHLGPIRRSLSRFTKMKNGLWRLNVGVAIFEETLLDGTGSMGVNVDLALKALLNSYTMLTGGRKPLLGRYDVQIATGVFNDVQDQFSRPGSPVLCRSQFEMAEKIAQQMSCLVPNYNGCGNGKEDSQFGLFGAAYLTSPTISRYGLRGYHFTVSDEPTVEWIDPGWLKKIFGDDVLERCEENGFKFTQKSVPDTQQAVKDLQKIAHAFFLQVHDEPRVKQQWINLYGKAHFVRLPNGTTEHLHCVKAVIVGLIEGVLDLQSAADFLSEHHVPKAAAGEIVRAVAHIPLAAQTLAPNFSKMPKKGDLFKEKTDLWPVDGVPDDVDDTDEGDAEEGPKIDWL